MSEIPPAGRGPEVPDVPDVIAKPPTLYTGFLVAGLLIELLAPTTLGLGDWRYWIGGLLAAAGVGLMAVAMGRFRRAGTNVETDRPTTALVESGPYRWSRNPIYVSLTLLYLGLAVLFDSVWALALIVPLLVLMEWGVIRREERYLEARFGEAYRDYCRRARRWF